MHWGSEGQATELTSGKSMDNPLNAFSAMSQCAHSDGYTMGLNLAAHERSRRDLLRFMRRTWRLDVG